MWKWQKRCFPEKLFSCVSDFWILFSCIKLRESFSGETYFQSEFSLKKNKNTRKIIQVHERKLFFFFNLVSHSPEKKNNLVKRMEKKTFLKKKKCFTWFLFSWGKKSFGWKKTKLWKKNNNLFAHGGGRGGQWQKLLLCQNWKEAKD